MNIIPGTDFQRLTDTASHELGVDVTDPQFWEVGLRLLGDMVAEAEELAARL